MSHNTTRNWTLAVGAALVGGVLVGYVLRSFPTSLEPTTNAEPAREAPAAVADLADAPPLGEAQAVAPAPPADPIRVPEPVQESPMRTSRTAKTTPPPAPVREQPPAPRPEPVSAPQPVDVAPAPAPAPAPAEPISHRERWEGAADESPVEDGVVVAANDAVFDVERAPAPPPEPKRVVTRVLPAGTELTVRFEDTVSSKLNVEGDEFTATLEEDLSVDDERVVPRGTTVVGRVTEAYMPNKVGGRARLGIEFHTLDPSDGSLTPIKASISESGKSQRTKDGAIIAGATVGGIILGEAIDEGEGGILGGIIGGLAGAWGAKKTAGKPVEIEAGTRVMLQLDEPATVVLSR